MKDIETALTKTPDDITSLALSKLFKGKSVNTPGYLLAVLKHEGVVQAVKGKKRKHTYIDIGRLTDLNKASTTKKVTAKKKAEVSGEGEQQVRLLQVIVGAIMLGILYRYQKAVLFLDPQRSTSSSAPGHAHSAPISHFYHQPPQPRNEGSAAGFAHMAPPQPIPKVISIVTHKYIYT